MSETYGSCDGCGRTAPLSAADMDVGGVWGLCDTCVLEGWAEGSVQGVFFPSPALVDALLTLAQVRPVESPLN